MLQRTFFASIVACVALAMSPVAGAGELAPIPDLHHRVTDTTATLSSADIATLDARLAALEQRKGAQVAILLVPTTAPEAIEPYATRVFAQWKLGRKHVDDGVLVLVAKDDHRVRIEVARGLEGAIPDAAAKRIEREYMTPKFRSGAFAAGLGAGVDMLTRLIDDEALPAPSARPASRGNVVVMDDEPWWSPIQLIAGIMFGAIVATLFLLLMMVRSVYNLVLGHLPPRWRAYAFGALTALPIVALFRHPMAALGAFAAASSIGSLTTLSRPPRRGDFAGGGGTSSSDGSSSSSSGGDSGGSSDSGSSGGSDFSGGGGESSGGGASDSW
jgi:uncharacterized protein